jgi:hypothetical protein
MKLFYKTYRSFHGFFAEGMPSSPNPGAMTCKNGLSRMQGHSSLLIVVSFVELPTSELLNVG